MGANDDAWEPRGGLLVAILLIGAVGLTGVFVPFVPSKLALLVAVPLALVLAYGTAWANAVAAARRRGRADTRLKRQETLILGTMLLLFAYYSVAMTLPFAWTTATGSPGRILAELEPKAIASRHRTCDYRLQDGITGLPGTVSVCVDGSTFRQYEGHRVLVEVGGPQTAFGLRIDDHDVREDLGPLR